MKSLTTRLSRVALRGTALLAGLTCINAYATTLEITFENLSPDDGLWVTPVFFGFHDGSFDTFDAGAYASSSIEAVAEGGDVSGLVSDISGTYGAKHAVLPSDFSAGGPPGVLFGPGSSNSIRVDLDEMYNRYLSFASMIVPSNDAFIGNDDPMAYELFTYDGMFNEGFSVDIMTGMIYDSGTELNDGLGAAFSTLGGESTDTNEMIALHTGLDTFVGTDLPVGSQLGSSTLYGRITARKVPDSSAYIGAISGLAILGLQVIRRRKKSV